MIDTSALLSPVKGADTVSFVPSDVTVADQLPANAVPSVSGAAGAAGTAAATTPAEGVGRSANPVGGAAGSSFPSVTTADLAVLRSRSPMIPVAGVTADKLIDSFDDIRGGGGRRHEAIDIMSPRGTQVVSADAGTVLKLHNSVAGGLSIYVADPTHRFIMLYAHLDRYRPGLAAGMVVKKGELLGYVGSTGNAAPAAPHLHFAIARSDNPREWWKGTPLNPFLIWRGK